ncbi:uncharacterized protein LOC125059060 isoform X2 [Pieris napi]|uniref:uncharacterized protein LOC125059060 isoform X2 n=1 Tax=Pieris napi TaxID=78633 RepID=UPI001FBA4903|nr:uncharacterized protein LOC125059060 isoform X2 [Pieris napi]
MNTLNSKSIGRCIGCLCEESVSTFKLKSEPLRVAFQEDCLKLCYICKKLACNADLFVRTVQTNQLRLQSLINGPDITDLNIESHPILQLQTKIIDLHSHKINELTPRIEQTSNIRVKLEKNDERDDEVCDDIQDGSDNNAEFDLSLVKQEDVELSFLDKDETIDKCTLQYYKLEKNDERDDELCDDIQDGLDNNAECDLLLVKQEDVEQSFLDKDETIEKCKKKVLKGKTSTEQTSNIGVKLEKNDERDDEVCYEIQDGSDNNAVSTIEISPNPEESSNVVTVQVDVHHRHWSQLSASVATTNHVCVNETQATNDVSSIHPGYPKTAAERMREYRARKKKETLTVNHQKQRRSAAQRAKEYRIRKKMKIHSGEITTLNMMDPCAHIPSTSSTPMETEDALPSTSAIPTTAEKNALRNREYRKRVAATRTPEQAAAFARKAAERQRKAYHLRRAANLALASGTVETTRIVQTSAQRKRASRQRQAERVRSAAQPSTSSNKAAVHQEQPTWSTKWSSSIHRFKSTFLDNDFGHTCSVCDRLWFRNDLKAITAAQMQIISDWCVKENRQVHAQEFTLVCANCKRSLNTGKLPSLAKMNGFTYPEVPPGLPPLDPISERLISPRLPFMQVRRLRHDDGIIGQVINVPVDVQEMVKCLPRQLDEDEVINVNIKRNLAHKTNYVSGYTSKRTIKEWLDVLQKSSLYRLYDIKVDLSKLQLTVPSEEILPDEPGPRIEAISAEYTPESEILAARQHTLLWNEEDCLDIAPGHRATPLNIIYDRHAEELSFPAIYFGEPRRFNMGVSVTPYMMATSEIRRSDRRGATPQKILYVAMKILRLRMVDGIYSTFRKVPVTENVTRRMLEDPEFLKEFGIQNLAFMKSVPNSVQYWTSRKRDLFAMLRQLGKPTIFLTLSANEVRWLTLLNLLLKLSNKYPGKVAEDLNTSERCSLVSDDPVTCCIYFHKLVGTLMNMLKAKSNYNPFGQYFVKDYFLRIEFQHRGSPHAHILLWLNNDPLETVSENMPNTIELVEKLSSVAKEDVPNDTIYSNQIHKHTFTCTKRGETTCRFGIPYWPMLTTRVLVPMPKTDGRRVAFQKKGKELRTSLSDRTYASMDDFLRDHSLTFDAYLDVVRSTLRRPTLLFKRNFDQLMTNTFNPYLAGEINSNIDIQFVLDDYSCAQYVVEYVNKSARGMGNLNRELAKMMQEHPDRDYTGQLKALSIKLLNAVEMSAQEAAWYLLRQPMSETSRQVVYIPTVWPSERQRCRKRRVQMNREGIDADSTDVWTKNIIQRYEERPPSLEPVYLAEFASWYAKCQDFIDNEDDVDVHEYENLEPETEEETTSRQYRRRQMGRIIRYRHYEVDEIVNYQREMVLLYLPFRNELSEIVDCNKFLQLYNDNKDVIIERRQIYEKNLNIDSVLQELEAMMILQNSNSTEPAETENVICC